MKEGYGGHKLGLDGMGRGQRAFDIDKSIGRSGGEGARDRLRECIALAEEEINREAVIVDFRKRPTNNAYSSRR